MAIATKKTGMVILIGVLVLGVGVFVYKSFTDSGPAFIDPSDQALVINGKEIYTNNCASCHGAELQGQPDWRTRLASGRLPAPPHDKTGHTTIFVTHDHEEAFTLANRVALLNAGRVEQFAFPQHKAQSPFRIHCP